MAVQQKKRPSTQFQVQDTVNKAEHYYRNNARIINIVGIVIILLIGGYFGYKYLYLAPREGKAQAMIFKAQQYFQKDSLRLALEGDGNNYGYLQVMQRYGGTKVGKLAALSAGICYVRLGEYQKGIDLLEKFHVEDRVMQPLAYGLLGDAYMELNKTGQGIAAYKKAGYYSDNDLIAPLYLMRAGLALEKAGKNKEAVAIYRQIKQKYPQSLQGHDIDKYLARAGDTE
ncbi:tetratricopeptide repeat protein [Compostibacter hankyongensis]|uniref:Tetratricopeptide repeat protein n=1 Tax=Compostibacter hankyongensis TaxID=1007089 RepID=A0ABP8FKG4_9BACT